VRELQNVIERAVVLSEGEDVRESMNRGSTASQSGW